MPTTRAFQRLVSPALLLLTASCREIMAGPCVHTYRDPLLAITMATEVGGTARVAPLLITGVTIGGQPMAASGLATFGYGIRARGDTLVCDVPCGFGTSEGTYAFTAVAPGFAPRQVSLDAHYQTFKGGCPSYNAGSMAVAIVLGREP
ncbi:MAG: hypothetical protein U0164_06605 [Gemmatimonadaceae bacterium]